MRGVVYANLSISSKSIDAHSGVDGGMVAEPMSDMVRLLGSISSGDNGGVALPGFCTLPLDFCLRSSLIHDHVCPEEES